MTHLEKMTRVEDLNLGLSFQMSPGYSPHAISGQTNASQLQSSFEKQYFVRDTDLFHERFSYTGRDTFDNAENEVFEVMLKYYRRPSDFHTTVFHTRLDWGHQLDPDNPIKLGGDNGLRAYESGRFVGSRSWVMNVEERLFLIDEAFNLLAVGGAVFADSGYAWPQGHPISGSRIKSEVGTGLRFGLTRSSNEVVLRFDVSYRLQTDDQSKARWVFTFGSGQAF
jgi:hemolysin activation/secretion protein